MIRENSAGTMATCAVIRKSKTACSRETDNQKPLSIDNCGSFLWGIPLEEMMDLKDLVKLTLSLRFPSEGSVNSSKRKTSAEMKNLCLKLPT